MTDTKLSNVASLAVVSLNSKDTRVVLRKKEAEETLLAFDLSSILTDIDTEFHGPQRHILHSIQNLHCIC